MDDQQWVILMGIFIIAAFGSGLLLGVNLFPSSTRIEYRQLGPEILGEGCYEYIVGNQTKVECLSEGNFSKEYFNLQLIGYQQVNCTWYQ